MGLTENVPPWVAWVFTTISEAKAQQQLFDKVDANPLLSRCSLLELKADQLGQ